MNVAQALICLIECNLNKLNFSVEVLETVKGTQWATGLHYAFHQGIWLFIVMGRISAHSVHTQKKKRNK